MGPSNTRFKMLPLLFPVSRNDIRYDMPMHVGEAEISALEAVGQAGVVNA